MRLGPGCPDVPLALSLVAWDSQEVGCCSLFHVTLGRLASCRSAFVELTL